MSEAVHCYFLPATQDAPNSRLPVLHYQDVLPLPLSEQSAKVFLTQHEWEHRGTWGHIAIRHFHPNTHECYGIFQGSSTLLIGQIKHGEGARIKVKAGDVIVLPAGTAHSSVESSPDYRYIGVYPTNCPRWRNEVGKKNPEVFTKEIATVNMPLDDPVYGSEGPLTQLWQPRALAKL
ncbi:hypothetical protein CC79DRAFT_1354735 [Sarocladium strictum]